MHIVRTCCKCGGHNIYGPIYNSKNDSLDYRCATCGFSWENEPLDARPRTPRPVNSRDPRWQVDWDSLPHDPPYPTNTIKYNDGHWINSGNGPR
jgi:hypothetical protein